ncbi:NAD(P)H-dependent oxidoreductase [Prosthecomicrobium sp. N25]|uniref:NAD(P)H-dependent oxidoreductase n=1 Tax=Prosthecomicrobium sp. N25 TaxID=3129254 RepID=UPI003076B2A8
MRVLVLYAHPVETSFNAAIHAKVVETLLKAGHEVDDCDLYAEGFDPVLTREERLAYHTVPDNRAPVQGYVDRVLAADAIVICSPVWNFGFPAILKGFFDRVFLPGVSFKIVDKGWRPALQHVSKIAAVMTYGGTRFRAFLVGDPPRKVVTRSIRAVIKPTGRCLYLAHYNMNATTPESRAAFLAKVEQEMLAF